MKRKRKDTSQEESKQLSLGMKDPFKNKFLKIKRSLNFAVLRLEVRKFLKDPLIWATLMISIVLIAQQIYLITTNLSSLPVYVPVFRYFMSIPRKLVGRDYVIIFPTISVISLLLSFLFTSRYYNSEKILTKLLLFAALLCTLSQTAILIDLINLF